MALSLGRPSPDGFATEAIFTCGDAHSIGSGISSIDRPPTLLLANLLLMSPVNLDDTHIWLSVSLSCLGTLPLGHCWGKFGSREEVQAAGDRTRAMGPDTQAVADGGDMQVTLRHLWVCNLQ